MMSDTVVLLFTISFLTKEALHWWPSKSSNATTLTQHLTCSSSSPPPHTNTNQRRSSIIPFPLLILFAVKRLLYVFCDYVSDDSLVVIELLNTRDWILNQQCTCTQYKPAKKLFSAAKENFLWVKLATAITWWNSRKFLSSSPLFTRFQSDRFFHCRSLNTQHVLVLFISKISHGLCLLVPRVPHNWEEEVTERSYFPLRKAKELQWTV